MQLDGKGFDVKVKEGDDVKQGDTLVEIDLNVIKESGKALISPIVFTDGKTVEVRKNNQRVAPVFHSNRKPLHSRKLYCVNGK